jgi:hypothetical protein
LGERVEQRAGDVVLADDVREERGTVFSGENLVRHWQVDCILQGFVEKSLGPT